MISSYLGAILMPDLALKICPYRSVNVDKPCSIHCPWCLPNDRGCGLIADLTGYILPKEQLTLPELKILKHLLLHGSSNVYSIYRYHALNNELEDFPQSTVHNAMKTLEEKKLVFLEDTVNGKTKQIKKIFGLTISGFRYATNHHFSVIRAGGDPDA